MTDQHQANHTPLNQSLRTVSGQQGRSFKFAPLLILASVLVGAGAFAMVQPATPTLPEQRLVADTFTLSLPVTTVDLQTDVNDQYRHETRIQFGDTISSIFSRLGVSEQGLMTFISTNEDTRKAARLLVPGRTVQASIDANGAMNWVRYVHTPGKEDNGAFVTAYLELAKNPDGSFSAQEKVGNTESQTHIASGRIKSSLFGATETANIPDGVTLQIAEILGGRMDFVRDIRKNDQFRVIYETRSFEGRPAGAGRVLALEFINGNKRYEAVWFEPKGGSGGYYDANGKSLRGAFLRSAIPFTRVSSKFGMRKHPIHKRWRSHNGIDFAAPTGTPIRATGDGVVKSIGTQGGYGKTIVLRHPNNITTLFAHQSRFAAGLSRGDRVSQGQIIGYVGSTGWSTGPHLHYEFRINNVPVDPLGIKLPEAIALDEQQKLQFAETALPLFEQLKQLAVLEEDNGDALQLATR